MLSFDDLRFPTDGWKLRKQDSNRLEWFTPEGVLITYRLFHGSGGGFTADITQPDKIRGSIEEANLRINSVLLDFSVGKIQGVERIRALSKTWNQIEGNDLGKRFFVDEFFLFMEGCFFLQAMAWESDPTGIREATVDAARIAAGQLDVSALRSGEPIAVSGGEDYVHAIKSAPMRVVAADDEKYDADFPSHPLSVLRSTIQKLEGAIVVSPQLKIAAPYRV